MADLSVGGLVSGMNTEDWVKKLIDAESISVKTQTNKKAAIAARQAAWKRVRTSLETLRLKLDSLRLTPAYNARLATSSDDKVAAATASPGATATTHTLSVSSTAEAHMVSGTSNLTDADTALGLSGTIKIGTGTDPAQWKSVTIGAADTLNTVKAAINNAGANVTADLVRVTNGGTVSYQLTLTSKLKGTANAIHLEDDPATLLLQDPKLNLLTGAGGFVSTLVAATDAVFTLDGASFTKSTNEITDVLAGVSFTVKKGGSATLTVAPDTTKVVEAVQGWVGAINDTFALLANETRVDPSTRNTGVLAGDSLARSLQTALRGFFSNVVPGLPAAANQLSQFGIKTGAYGSADYGKVVLDSAKLADQLKANPDSVARLFGALQDLGTGGIATDMYKYVNDTLRFVTGPLDTRDSTLAKQIKQIDNTISAMNDRLRVREQTLRLQFSRMERVLARFNAQSNALFGQFSSNK